MRRVLVTGASRGIGRAIALESARQGFDPVLHYHSNRAAAEAVAEEVRRYGGTGTTLCFDCADRERVRTVIEADIAANGCYYGVVCNAGVADDNPFPALEDGQWDRVLRTDLDGFYNVLKPIVMPMVSERIRGRIIAIASISGLIGNRGQVNYSAAKAGIIGAAKALAVELAKRQITVNCVAPGLIYTKIMSRYSKADIQGFNHKIPVGRGGTVEEIVPMIQFLADVEKTRFIVGQVICVDGGQSCDGSIESMNFPLSFAE